MSSSSLVATEEGSLVNETITVAPNHVTNKVQSNDPQQQQQTFDFIGSSGAVKDLFALPYSIDRPVSVAVHNLQGTLLLDGGYDPKILEKPDNSDTFRRQPSSTTTPLSNSETKKALVGFSQLQSGTPGSAEALTIVRNALVRPETDEAVEPEAIPPAADQHPFPMAPDPREYLPWTFHDMNLLVGSDAMIYRSSETPPTAVRVEDADHMQGLGAKHATEVASGDFVPDYQLIQRKSSYADAAARSMIEAEVETPSSRPENLVDQVELKSCIIPNPSNNGPVASLMRVTQDSSNVDISKNSAAEEKSRAAPVTPVTTVLDTYLDNIMADVPQLALCLREKGFIQSIKLLSTSEIPSRLLHAKTLDTSVPFAICDSGSDPDEQIFSPEIMEMNAHALLRFLKANCSKDNGTYILRREAGCSNVQLFDISNQHQKQWIWRLANLSYRFANRLRHLSLQHPSKSRNFRSRQRSLLQTTLELLETLADHDGHRHESMVAAVNEALGDTFLVSGSAAENNNEVHSPTKPVSSHLPYAQVSVDSLGKAEDHLVYGVKVLRGLLDSQRRRRLRRDDNDDVSNCSDSDADESSSSSMAIEEIQPVLIQLLGISEKLVHVNLRLAFAMHNLRKAARRLATSIDFLDLLDIKPGWVTKLQHQYAWLWEQCGHFARSFAADDQWRELGHASGADVVGVIHDVETALLEAKSSIGTESDKEADILLAIAKLHGIVDCSCSGFKTIDDESVRLNGIHAARERLASRKTLQREKLDVLVASCFAYGRALAVLKKTELPDPAPVLVLQQRLGDSCNELGKVMLDELRSLIISDPKSVATASAAEAFASSAEFHFTEGLSAFEACKDRRNMSLLRCNLCQCFKLRANTMFSHISAKSRTPHSEICLEWAAKQLTLAHESLEVRDFDPDSWDMVSVELAATYLVLGIRRRQSMIGAMGNKSMFLVAPLSPGMERSIVDPIEKSLKIYDTMGNLSQAAAAHYQLALFFVKIWTCQRDEFKTREKLARAFHHFQQSHQTYRQVIAGNESTFALVCLDLADLYATVSGEEGLSKALLCCLDTAASFNSEYLLTVSTNSSTRKEWLEKMNTIASSVEERLFGLLKSLAKIQETTESGHGQIYKDMYRVGLTTKLSNVTFEPILGDATLQGYADHVSSLGSILRAIAQCYTSHKHTP